MLCTSNSQTCPGAADEINDVSAHHFPHLSLELVKEDVRLLGEGPDSAGARLTGGATLQMMNWEPSQGLFVLSVSVGGDLQTGMQGKLFLTLRTWLLTCRAAMFRRLAIPCCSALGLLRSTSSRSRCVLTHSLKRCRLPGGPPPERSGRTAGGHRRRR